MLTVDEYARIRRAHRDGMSVRAIARTFHHTRRKIREVLANPEPKPYTRRKPPRAPKLGPYVGLIDAILAADEQAPRKQRHSMQKIYRRLLAEHGYPGKYDQVRRYVNRTRRRERETFIPLAHDPGQRAECDFGHVWVDFPDGRRQVAVLIVAWAFSYGVFAIALPTERTEAILHGMVQAFEFFGCVPREAWWDNPATVAVQILSGRERRINERYQALASHYNFEPLFCLPARGNEKPHVENRVKWLEREWATPVPQAQDLAAFNARLRDLSVRDQQRVATGQSASIGERFEQDRAAALALPARRFDACIAREANVDKYQMARFDNVSYSVPHTFAFQTVTVKGYVDRIEIVFAGQVVARHERCYEPGRQILDPLHYLVTLSRKPACLDQTAVYRNWRLPPSFTALREALEAQHGPFSGARQFVRVLQLLQAHPQERVERAIASRAAGEGPSAAVIVARTERLREREWQSPPAGGVFELPASVPPVQVPPPDLRRFNQFLSRGDSSDAR